MATQSVWHKLGIFVATATLTVACGDVEPQTTAPGKCEVSATAAVDPGTPGPYRAGHRVIEVTYQPKGVAEPRKIPLHIWYPTNATEGDPTTYIELFEDANSFQNAPLAPPLSGCGYPTIAYSHGHQGFAGTGAHLMRHFASHGWVGIAPDHVQNLLNDNVDPRPTWMYYVRSLDISASLDVIAKLPSNDPLANKIATDRVILAGHSYGTHTVWASAGATFDVARIREACKPGGSNPSGECTEDQLSVFTSGVRDTRIVGGMPLAGTWKADWFGDTGVQNVKIPLLQMTGSKDDVGAMQQWEQNNGLNMSWIDIAGACHESFATGICNDLPVPEGYSIVQTYAMAFARYHLLGDRSSAISGIVDGSQNVSAKVTYRRK